MKRAIIIAFYLCSCISITSCKNESRSDSATTKPTPEASTLNQKTFSGKFIYTGGSRSNFNNFQFKPNGVVTFDMVPLGATWTHAYERSGSLLTIKKVGIEDVIVEIESENSIIINGAKFTKQ